MSECCGAGKDRGRSHASTVLRIWVDLSLMRGVGKTKTLYRKRIKGAHHVSRCDVVSLEYDQFQGSDRTQVEAKSSFA